MHVGGGRRDWRLPGESARQDWGSHLARGESAAGGALQELRFVSIPQAVPGCPPTVGPWERELAAEAFTHGKTQEMGSLGS